MVLFARELKFADDECNIGRNHTLKANLLHSSQRGTNIRFASWFRDFSTTAANSEQHCIILVSLEVVWHILFHFCTFISFRLLSLFGDVPASMFWFCFSNGPNQNGNIWKHIPESIPWKVMERLTQAAPRVVLSESQASELTRLPGADSWDSLHFYGEWIDFKLVPTQKSTATFWAWEILKSLLNWKLVADMMQKDVILLGMFSACFLLAARNTSGVSNLATCIKRSLHIFCTSFGCLGNDWDIRHSTWAL